MEKQQLIISPKTKVLQLIETYPQLEQVLIDYVPAFKKLKNPILRNTVAKVATLQQAAGVGGVKVSELINRLRKEVGQELFADDIESAYNTTKPAWFDANLVTQELDVRPMLEAGEHPVNQVIPELHKMPAGRIYKLIAPFLPAPLIEKALSLKLQHWVVKEQEELFTVYFYKPGQSGQ
ncbi:MAG: DUF1858 domain-containing protein [Ignavibacteriae bacterium]|nr:DUF1858 domain-containing protein [Ignavibacteriota bacterium]